MLQPNHVGSYTQAHKGIFQHLTDQVMAKLTKSEAVNPKAPEPGEPPAISDHGSNTPSFFFNPPQQVCKCAACAALRRLL